MTTDTMGFAASVDRQMELCRLLAVASEQMGYLLIPQHTDTNHNKVAPWTSRRATTGTRGWLGGIHQHWGEARGQWPLTIWASVDDSLKLPMKQSCTSLTFSTSRIMKWNRINAALHLLTGGPLKTRFSNGNSHCVRRSNRFDFLIKGIESTTAAFAILDMPDNRAFLTGGNTTGRRRAA